MQTEITKSEIRRSILVFSWPIVAELMVLINIRYKTEKWENIKI